MKRLSSLVCALALSGCVMPTKQPAPTEVAQTPVDRLLAFQQPSSTTGELVVTRDVGMIGGGCFLGVLVDGTLAGKLDPGERASFHLDPGVHLVAPTWVDGRGLCGAFYNDERASARRRTTEVTISSGTKKNYRIHTNTDGESTLEPTM